MKNQTETKQTAKKRNNKRTVEEQVEVAPWSCRTTPALRSVSALRTRVGMNPLCQEQCLVSGENLFLFLRPAYETRVWGAGAQKKTPRDPLPRNSAPSRDWGRSSFTYTFYLGHANRAKGTTLVEKASVFCCELSSRAMYICQVLPIRF